MTWFRKFCHQVHTSRKGRVPYHALHPEPALPRKALELRRLRQLGKEAATQFQHGGENGSSLTKKWGAGEAQSSKLGLDISTSSLALKHLARGSPVLKVLRAMS